MNKNTFRFRKFFRANYSIILFSNLFSGSSSVIFLTENFSNEATEFTDNRFRWILATIYSILCNGGENFRLKSKDFKTLSEFKQKLFCSSNNDFKKFYQSLIMSSNDSRMWWKLMNEIRNSARTRTHICSFRKIFNDYIQGAQENCNLLNYRFSQLGKFLLSDETCKYIEGLQPKLFRLHVLQNLNAYSAFRCSIETKHRDHQRYTLGFKRCSFCSQ